MRKRQRVYRRRTPVFPRDFPERLERLRQASGLSWYQLARALGTEIQVVRGWRQGKRPAAVYLFALFELADTVPTGRRILLEGAALGGNSSYEDRGER